MERQNLGEKFTVKGVILLILLIAFLIAVPLAINNMGEPKTPATSEQVCATIEKYGLAPNNFTDEYVKDYPKLGFISVAGYRTDNFRIEFFEMENYNRAHAIMVELNQIILDARDITNDIEFEEANKHYYIHTYNVDDKHFWLMQIDNTVIYGFCYDENYNKMVDIMVELGYTSE